MNNSIKLILIYIAAFAAIFTLNALLSMDATHGFFYLTPAKLVIRLMIALLITVQIVTKINIPIPKVPVITFMVILFMTIVILLLSSCLEHTPKYKVTGSVPYKGSTHPAIWMTDTLSFNGDTALYTNSDGTVMTIAPPYTIDTLE